MIYAEVIGDPIAQSKSPVIHKHWLGQLGIEGDYQRTRVAPEDLADFLAERRSGMNWRGCNVTIPHKETIIPLLDRLDPGAEAIGAVNCVVPANLLPATGRGTSGALVGYNTDIDGVAAALDDTELEGRKAIVIGAGGGARAVVAYLSQRQARITILARNPGKAEPLRAVAAESEILPLDRADEGLEGAAAIVNASPLGMTGAPPMPRPLLEAVTRNALGATLFDMVTTPAATRFLAAGLTSAEQVVDGLTMLVGQAARAFELFFGVPAPPPDAQLRDLLTADSRDSG
jgi:shikimate dehydrogenase